MDRKIKQQKFSVSSKLLNSRHLSQFDFSHTVKETVNDFEKFYLCFWGCGNNLEVEMESGQYKDMRWKRRSLVTFQCQIFWPVAVPLLGLRNFPFCSFSSDFLRT